jgi:glycosyltransferase involved in cell wall biosynthesis
MNILWISDFGVHHNIGGAQRSNLLIIEEGKKRNHSIEEFYFDTDPHVLNNTYDMIVSSNLETLSRKMPNIISYIASHPNHVRLEHDANRYLTTADRKKLFRSCKKTFFLTQFHYDQFIDMYGSIFQNVEIIPDPIDTNVFYNMEKERENKILNVGFMHRLKGTENFFHYVLNSPEISFVMAAWGDPTYENAAKSIKNIEWLGRVPYNAMPELYNRYTTMYYHPVFYEPFCRSVGEAMLCGMNINANHIVGSLHYYHEIGKEKFKTQCHEAPQTFWNKIHGLCNRNPERVSSP